MSICGKSDFMDWCEMLNTPSEIVKNTKLYVNNNRILINDELDLIPYYPYLISSMCCSKTEGNVVNLCSQSYIHMRNAEMIKSDLDSIIRLYKKAKRNKIPFNYDYVMSQNMYFICDNETVKIIIETITDNLAKLYNPLSEDVIVDNFFHNVWTKWSIGRIRDFIELAVNRGYSLDYLKIMDAEKINSTEMNFNGRTNPILTRLVWSIAKW